MKKWFTAQQGFSLTEVMVSMAIFVLVAAAVNTVLIVGDASWQTNNVQVQLQQELRKAMEWMKDDLRQTGSAAIMNVPVNVAPDIAAYPDPTTDPAYNWYTAITFQKAAGTAGGVIAWNANATQFVLNATNLQRIEGAQTRTIATNIQTLQFRRLNATPDILEVALLAQRRTYGGAKGITISSTLDFKVQLRN